ncbi:MAG: YraN family protein [Candidatus Taylorbacteria bacterium]|nr:YraN family protein [Candidatus Taylorbacteria bacterium]
MQKKKTEIGRLGEDIACKFLMKHGYSIMDRNYRKKWGEIDIVAERHNLTCFVEVKSVSGEINDSNVSYETDGYRPEDNVHSWKLKRLSRAIQTYILEKKVGGEWGFGVITVKIDSNRRRARVSFIDDIVL